MKLHRQKQRFSPGLSLIETLIVITILAILILMGIMAMQKQITKGRDAERKADLEKIKLALEDYYNDNDCYPVATWLVICGASLSPYLKEIPCDPQTGDPYEYLPVASCAGYRVLTALENQNDPSSLTVGCDGTVCGTNSPYNENNYGISQGVQVPEAGF